MLTGVVSKQTIDDLKEELSHTWYGIATDGCSSVVDKHLLILIQHVGKTTALIEASLLDIPNVNSGSTGQKMFNVCNEVIENFSLDWNKFLTYFSDNAIFMIGRHTACWRKLRTLRLNKKFLILVVQVILPIFLLEKERGNCLLILKIF